MILRLILAVILGFMSAQSGRDTEDHLLGCPDPLIMAEALKRIEQSDWRKLSLSEVQMQWPWHLKGLECDSKTCSMVGHEGRIINNECECCVTFVFDAKPIEGALSGHLKSVVIKYSTHERAQIVVVAKMLTEAVGFSKERVEAVGRKPRETFNRDIREGQQLEIRTGEFELLRKESTWLLYLSYARYFDSLN